MLEQLGVATDAADTESAVTSACAMTHGGQLLVLELGGARDSQELLRLITIFFLIYNLCASEIPSVNLFQYPEARGST
jgi:hypothetical protein